MRHRLPRRLPSLFGALLCLLLTLVPAWEAAAEPLRVGIFPRHNATNTTRMFTPLVNYLERELRRPVQLVTAKDFDAFWEGVRERRFHLVHFNQLHSLRARAFGYRVVASNQEFGSDTMAGAIYVRKDSGIQSLADLKGKKVVFGGSRDAMMAYIVPRFLLKKAGLGEEDYKTDFALSPPNAVLAVIYRQADAGAAGDVVLRQPLADGRADREAVTILAQSEQLRQLPWAVSDSLPEAASKRLIELLLALDEGPAGKEILQQAGLTGLSPASDADYEPFREIIEAVQGTLE
jgi:phosphonate transport system substrate-binding protein